MSNKQKLELTWIGKDVRPKLEPRILLGDRAWFDDGTPLGSADNVECRIDALAQSWAVLSGAGDPERSRSAMQYPWTNTWYGATWA